MVALSGRRRAPTCDDKGLFLSTPAGTVPAPGESALCERVCVCVCWSKCEESARFRAECGRDEVPVREKEGETRKSVPPESCSDVLLSRSDALAVAAAAAAAADAADAAAAAAFCCAKSVFGEPFCAEMTGAGIVV